MKNGRRVAPVKGATLIGSGPAAMKQIKALGNDLALDPGMGNCESRASGCPWAWVSLPC